MAIKKKTVTCTGTTALTQSLDLGTAVGEVVAIDLLSDVDTTVSVTITDARSRTIATAASGDYTSAGAQQAILYLSPVEATVWDSAGEVMAANGDASIGVIAESPLSVVAAGLDASETCRVNVYVRV